MKKSTLLFLILTLAHVICAQEKEYNIDKVAITSFLKQYCVYTDPNPIWQEEANVINSFFCKVVDGDYEEKDVPDLRIDAFLMLYDNAVFTFEDAVDVSRMSRRKSLCYLTLAFLSDEDRYGSFLEDAANCFTDGDAEMELASVNLAELLIISGNKNIPKHEIEYKITFFRNVFEQLRDAIPDKGFVDGYSKILEGME